METLNSNNETMTTQPSLGNTIANVVSSYLRTGNNNEKPTELYDFVLSVVEPPLFEVVMRHTMGNQVKAAKLLGVSRGTLRKKLEKYFGEKYFKNKH